MSSINNTVKEIVLLDKQLHNKLKITGGSKDDLNNFSSKIKKNKKTIFITSIVTITILHIIVIIKLIKSNTDNEVVGGDINEMVGGDINEPVGGREALIESVKENFKSITSINGLLLSLKSVYDLVNNFIGVQFTLINKMIPFSIKYNINMYYYLTIIVSLIIAIIIFYVFNYIIDRKITIPCTGCAESNIWFKCLPGTGKGSIVCSIQKAITKVLLAIYKIIKKQIDLLISLLKTIGPIIENIINLVSGFISNVNGVISIDFSFFAKLENPIPTIPTANIEGIHLGKLLICPGYPIVKHSDINKCIYKSDGSLRDNIGNGPILETLFRIIRIIVKIPKAPTLDLNFTGGANPDIVFITLLKGFTPLEINPIKVICIFINILIKAISSVMKVVVSALKATVTVMLKFLKNTIGGLIEQIESIVNFIIQPVFIVTSIILGIPKKLFKIVTLVNKVGLGNIMLYNLFGGMLETIQDPVLFAIILTTIIVTLTVLIVCPYIGIMYNAFSYTKYFVGLQIRILTYILNYLKDKQLDLFTLSQKVIKEWLDLLEKKI